jgi:hypothetical protein
MPQRHAPMQQVVSRTSVAAAGSGWSLGSCSAGDGIEGFL